MRKTVSRTILEVTNQVENFNLDIARNIFKMTATLGSRILDGRVMRVARHLRQKGLLKTPKKTLGIFRLTARGKKLVDHLI
jgi:hypothetical protein